MLIYAPSTAQVAITNFPVCTAPLDQPEAVMTSDGGGYSLVAWSDYRNGNADIFAQKLDGAGHPQWIQDGVAVCKAASAQSTPQIVTDGFGGAIVVWADNRSGTSTDIYAQRLSSEGNPRWTTDGVVVSAAA